MKYKGLYAVALCGMLVLSGCSASSTQKDGKYVLASIDGKDILADDVYDALSTSTSGKSELFSYVLDQLIKEKFPVTDDMKENAAEIVSNIEANYTSQYGDEAEDYLASQLASGGYEDMDDYEESLIDSLQYSEFIKAYVKDNFDEVFDDYYNEESPRILSIIKVSASDVDNLTDEEKENLEEVENLLKTDKSFADIAADYSDDTSKSAKGNIGVVDSTSDLASTYGEDVETAALSLKAGATASNIKGTDGYYFIYCSSTDKDVIKDELDTVDIESPLLVYDDYLVYLAFNSYKLEYGNDDVKAIIEEVVNDALEERTNERSDS